MTDLRLADLLTITKDGEWGEAESDASTVPMLVIRGTDFADVRYGDLSSLPLRYIPSAIAARKQLQPGDILIETAGGTRDQPTGRTVLLKDRLFAEASKPITCASFSRFLRVNRDLIHPDYLYWFLQYLYLTGDMYPYHVQHTGVARFQYTQFATQTFIPRPTPKEQEAIAELLNALEDKIELNKRTNQTLEAMARALFKDWFIDFGPTRTKAARQSPYLGAPLWALFPDTLDNEDRPVGWAAKPLAEIADFLNGLALQKYPPDGKDSLPVIKIAELRQGITFKSDRASEKIPAAYIINDEDILFSWSGSLTHLIWTGGRGALNQHLFKVTPRGYPKWFVFYWISHYLPRFQAIAASKATTMGHIQRHHLTEVETTVPDDKVLANANQTIGDLFDNQFSNNMESRTLSQLRNLLLPKLMAGQIRLKDAEKKIQEAL